MKALDVRTEVAAADLADDSRDDIIDLKPDGQALRMGSGAREGVADGHAFLE